MRQSIEGAADISTAPADEDDFLTGRVGDASEARQEALTSRCEAERHKPASERAAVGAPRQERREAQIGEGDALEDQVVEYRPPREGRGTRRALASRLAASTLARCTRTSAICEAHNVSYSIGLVGEYLLHVRLHAARRSAAGLALPAGRDAGTRARAGDDPPRAEHCRHCRHGRQVGMRRAHHDV